MNLANKYPGLYQSLQPLARESIDEYFGSGESGACYGSQGNTGKKIVYVFDRHTIAIVDGFQVLPLPISSLGNRRKTEKDENHNNLGFTFDHKEYLMMGLTRDDLSLVSKSFLDQGNEQSDSQSEDVFASIFLATTPYIHGYEVIESRGIAHAREDNVELALNELKRLAMELGANGVVGVVIAESLELDDNQRGKAKAIAYGTTVKIKNPGFKESE